MGEMVVNDQRESTATPAPSARPTTTMPASSRNYGSPIDDRPTTTAVGSRQSAFTALKTESGRISPNQQEDRQANLWEDTVVENKGQAKAVDTTLADADGNMMSSRSIMSRGGVFEACFRREERVGNFLCR